MLSLKKSQSATLSVQTITEDEPTLVRVHGELLRKKTSHDSNRSNTKQKRALQGLFRKRPQRRNRRLSEEEEFIQFLRSCKAAYVAWTERRRLRTKSQRDGTGDGVSQGGIYDPRPIDFHTFTQCPACQWYDDHRWYTRKATKAVLQKQVVLTTIIVRVCNECGNEWDQI